jgi:hypothetical protein
LINRGSFVSPGQHTGRSFENSAEQNRGSSAACKYILSRHT